MTERRLLDERDAAAYLRLGVSTLQKYRCYGGGPTFVRLGCVVRYDIVDLDAWIQARKVTKPKLAVSQ